MSRRGWRSHFLLQCIPDGLKYGLRFSKNIVVPEPQHLYALAFERGGADFILRGSIEVLRAVEFECELGLMAIEVEDDLLSGDFQRMLPTEFRPVNAPVAHQAPDQLLRVGLLFT